MLPGINPKKMQAMMKQMGISQEEIDTKRVIIEKQDNSKIIIENPSVSKINMQGQTNFQISGDITEEDSGLEEEEEDSDIDSEELEKQSLEKDIQTIIEKTGCSQDIAAIELEKNNGDIAETIISLSESKNK